MKNAKITIDHLLYTEKLKGDKEVFAQVVTLAKEYQKAKAAKKGTFAAQDIATLLNKKGYTRDIICVSCDEAAVLAQMLYAEFAAASEVQPTVKSSSNKQQAEKNSAEEK